MAANITDYVALQNAKVKTDRDFEDMLTNLNDAKARINQMNENSWKGSSGEFFNEVFTEIQAKINEERNEFNRAMDEKLKMWHDSFSDAEKTEIQRANQM